MEIKYTKPFEKDLKILSDKTVILRIDEFINEIASSPSLQNIKGLKALKGHRDCYRIRIGNYRLGIILKGKVLWFARIMHRKEIYRFFP